MIVELKNVEKRFRQGDTEIRALAGLSLTVPRGEFVAVMGPSGSGKSTLLHLIAGLDRPDFGEIHVAGHRLSGLSDTDLTVFRRRNIGFVFQFFHLLPMLSAEENVALPLLLDGKTLAEVQPQVQQVMDRIGILNRRLHRPDALSGGEMQRVAIARALVVKPQILLADEPTGNLDSRTGKTILDLIRELALEERRTVIMVTHDAEAASRGERLLVMRDGRVQEEHPSTRIGSVTALRRAD